MARLLRVRNILILLVLVLGVLLTAAIVINASLFADRSDDDSKQALLPAQTALVVAAKHVGATDIEAVRRRDGGLRIYGRLHGHTFAVAVPIGWNHQLALFANGYSSPGSPFQVHKDPLNKYLAGVLGPAYQQGFAVGDISYDQSGLSYASSVLNHYALKGLLESLGTRQTYMIGTSMGGNIAMDLVGKYPHDFVAALPLCGVVGSWRGEIGYLVDMRASYNYFTRGTAYQLPGAKDLQHNAVATLSQGIFRPIGGLLQAWQMKRITAPIFKLFAAAAAQPNGPEAKIIDNILVLSGTDVALTGDHVRDPASVAIPLLTIAYGMDNVVETFHGQIYDNSAKVYHSPYLSAAQNAALNADIQRIHSTPEAVAREQQWTSLLGQSQAKILSIHNRIDPLVPNVLNEGQLRQAILAAGKSQLLVQREVPPQQRPLEPLSPMQGYVHCGFTPAQLSQGWNDLRAWVETGTKPRP